MYFFTELFYSRKSGHELSPNPLLLPTFRVLDGHQARQSIALTKIMLKVHCVEAKLVEYGNPYSITLNQGPHWIHKCGFAMGPSEQSPKSGLPKRNSSKNFAVLSRLRDIEDEVFTMVST